jgi:hypothetical protein
LPLGNWQNTFGKAGSDRVRKLMKFIDHSRQGIAMRAAAREESQSRMLFSVFMFVIALYFLLPGNLLVSIGWNYLGGATEFEKIHPATYLLVAVFFWALIVDRAFRWRCFAYSATDYAFIAFAFAVLATATFAIAARGASAANLIDTFAVALIVTISSVAFPRRPMVQFRTFIHIFCIVNIALILAEYVLKQNFIFEGSSFYDIATAEIVTEFRAVGLFGHPLTAAGFFSLYSVLNLVATSVRLSLACAIRLLLSGLSFIAIFPTGGRSALVVSGLVMLVYVAWSALRSLARGSFSKAGFVYLVICLIVLVLTLPIMGQLGIFDVMLGRFENDYGSALSRDYALQILLNTRLEDLWFGLAQQDVLTLQKEFGLIAIENTWINFTLVCGLVFTVPLLVTYVLFLFRSNPRYCTSGIYYLAFFQFILSNSTNGLWSKNTGFATAMAMIFSFLRKDMFIPSWSTSSRRGSIAPLGRSILADNPARVLGRAAGGQP